MSPMAQQILDLVRRQRNVSFVELERIEGFGGGKLELGLEGNFVLWTGLTPEAVAALDELRGFIYPRPAHLLVYLHDGQGLDLPIAKSARHYKKPHWLPVVFNPK